MWLAWLLGKFHRNQNHQLGIPSNGGFMQKGALHPPKCPEQQVSGLGIKDKKSARNHLHSNQTNIAIAGWKIHHL